MNINFLVKRSIFQCMTLISQPIQFSFAYLKAKPNKKPQVPLKYWKIVTGDVIKVRTGPDKGKVSKVLKVIKKANKVVIEDVNMQIKTLSIFISYFRGSGLRIKNKTKKALSNSCFQCGIIR